MKRVPVNFSNELHDFFKNIAVEKGQSFSKVCSDVLENFKNDKQDFEKKVLNELTQSDLKLQKMTLKLGEIERNLTASLIINKHIFNESSTSGFFVKQQYNDHYQKDPKTKDHIFGQLKNYNDEKDKIFTEILKKSGVV